MAVRFKEEEAEVTTDDDSRIDSDGLSGEGGNPDGCLGHFVGALGSHPARSGALVVGWLAMVTTIFCCGFVHDHPYTVVDALYLTAQILTTVGYGDMPLPKRWFGQCCMIVMILSNLLVITQIVTAVASAVVAAEKRVVKDAMVAAERSRILKGAVFAAESVSVQTSRVLRMKVPIVKGDIIRQKTRSIQRGRADELCVTTLVLCSLVVIWGLFFRFYPGEEKTFIQAVYFGVVTMSTVGFGDVLPVTAGGRLFAAVGMIVGAAAFAIVAAKFTWFTYHYFQDLSITKIDKRSLCRMIEFKRRCVAGTEDAKRAYHLRLAQKFEQGGFESLHEAFSSRMSRNDFIVFMLMDMDLIAGEVLQMLNEQFDQLDATGEGYIDDQDIAANHMEDD